MKVISDYNLLYDKNQSRNAKAFAFFNDCQTFHIKVPVVKRNTFRQMVNSPRLTRAETGREEPGYRLLRGINKPKFPRILAVGS